MDLRVFEWNKIYKFNLNASSEDRWLKLILNCVTAARNVQKGEEKRNDDFSLAFLRFNLNQKAFKCRLVGGVKSVKFLNQTII